MWWWIWVLGVLLLIVGGAWIGRRLWRSAKALKAAAGDAAALADRFAHHQEAAAARYDTQIASDLDEDLVELRGRVAVTRARRARTKALRYERRQRTWSGWGNFNE